jgi:hypothetical protein
MCLIRGAPIFIPRNSGVPPAVPQGYRTNNKVYYVDSESLETPQHNSGDRVIRESFKELDNQLSEADKVLAEIKGMEETKTLVKEEPILKAETKSSNNETDNIYSSFLNNLRSNLLHYSGDNNHDTKPLGLTKENNHTVNNQTSEGPITHFDGLPISRLNITTNDDNLENKTRVACSNKAYSSINNTSGFNQTQNINSTIQPQKELNIRSVDENMTVDEVTLISRPNITEKDLLNSTFSFLPLNTTKNDTIIEIYNNIVSKTKLETNYTDSTNTTTCNNLTHTNSTELLPKINKNETIIPSTNSTEFLKEINSTDVIYRTTVSKNISENHVTEHFVLPDDSLFDKENFFNVIKMNTVRIASIQKLQTGLIKGSKPSSPGACEKILAPKFKQLKGRALQKKVTRKRVSSNGPIDLSSIILNKYFE